MSKAAAFYALSNRETAHGYNEGFFRTASQRVSGLWTLGTNVARTGAVNMPFLPLAWGQAVRGVTAGSAPSICSHFFGAVTLFNDDDPPVQAAAGCLEASETRLWWGVDGVYTENGGVQAIDILGSSDGGIPYGRQNPQVCLRLAGDAYTAVAALNTNGDTITGWEGEMHFHDPIGYESLYQWTSFQNEPPNGAGDSTAICTDLLYKLENGAAQYVLGVTSAGVVVQANDCGFAAVAPEGRVWIRPEQVGALAEQIPTDVALNTAAHFEFHPSVFFRTMPYMRGVVRGNRDATELNAQFQGSQPIRITTVTESPTASVWLVIVDGVPSALTLLHPAGSDLRTPLEIWNALWVPIISGGQGASSALQAFTANTLPSLGYRADRWQYLSYARMLFTAGADTVDITQTNTQLL